MSRRRIPGGAARVVQGLFKRFTRGLRNARSANAPNMSGSRSASGGGTPRVNGPAANLTLNPPSSRHDLNRIGAKAPAKAKNTIVLPGVDTKKDIADIQAGKGIWDPATSRYTVNGRTYGVEPNGTVFPTEGSGLVNLSRPEYKVLQEMIKADGDLVRAYEAIRRNPAISDNDFRAALEVFKLHRGYKGG